jgi:hypothetical protein
MRRLITLFGMVGMFGLTAVSSTVAAPVPGYEGLYNTVYTSCTLPDGSLAACESAINGYAGALVADVEPEAALQSFIALRSEVFAANSADDEFQAQVDALFELLLPDSGAIGLGAPGDPIDPASSLVDVGGDVPASPT